MSDITDVAKLDSLEWVNNFYPQIIEVLNISRCQHALVHLCDRGNHKVFDSGRSACSYGLFVQNSAFLSCKAVKFKNGVFVAID